MALNYKDFADRSMACWRVSCIFYNYDIFRIVLIHAKVFCSIVFLFEDYPVLNVANYNWFCAIKSFCESISFQFV